MANKTESQSSEADIASVNPLAQLQKAGLGNMVGASTAMMEALSDMSAEMVGFIAARIKEDVKTQHEILHCKDLSKLPHIQAEFIQKAMDQYHDEAGKLVELGSKVFTPKANGEA